MSDTQSNAPTTVTVQAPPKSMVAAFFLTLLFGPLGLLYASITGGIILIIAAIVLIPFTAGMGAFLIWPASVIWGLVAAAASNRSA